MTLAHHSAGGAAGRRPIATARRNDKRQGRHLRETNGMTTQMTRRGALATWGAGAALTISPAWTSASAAVTASGKATPAFYRHKIGDIEVTQLSDGTAQFPL